jgi:rod shape-determining protein MreC
LKPARDLVNWVDETFAARGDKDRLETEVQQLRGKVAAGETALSENNQLRKLVGLWYSTVTIDHGTSAGVAVNDPVINGDGLVGRVTSATAGTAQVTLITDHTSAVSAKVVPDGIQGVIRPEVGDPTDLVLDFIDSSKHVRVGETVVTSGWKARGLSSLYPYGIPLGRVTQASVAEQEASQQVHVRPYADLRQLEFVQVLTK